MEVGIGVEVGSGVRVASGTGVMSVSSAGADVSEGVSVLTGSVLLHATRHRADKVAIMATANLVFLFHVIVSFLSVV